MEALAVLAALVSLFSMLYWMVMGARAVRAHELMANSMELVAKAMREQRSGGAPE